MYKNEREEEILHLIQQAGYMSIRDLAEKTYTSQSTIRRDLELPENCPVIPFSAEKGNGRDDLIRLILDAVESK